MKWRAGDLAWYVDLNYAREPTPVTIVGNAPYQHPYSRLWMIRLPNGACVPRFDLMLEPRFLSDMHRAVREALDDA